MSEVFVVHDPADVLRAHSGEDLLFGFYPLDHAYFEGIPDLSEEDMREYSQYAKKFDLREDQKSVNDDRNGPRRSAMKRFVQFAFDLLEIDGKNIMRAIDIGSGHYAEMVHQLLPEVFRDKTLLIDVNPIAVRESRKRYPDLNIVEGSYYFLDEIEQLSAASIDAAFGLSVLVTSTNCRRIFEQLMRVLRKNGIFIHLQDLVGSPTILVKDVLRISENGHAEIIAQKEFKKGEMSYEEYFASVYGFRINGIVYSLSQLYRIHYQHVLDNMQGIIPIYNEIVGFRDTHPEETNGSEIYQDLLTYRSTLLPPVFETRALLTLAMKT